MARIPRTAAHAKRMAEDAQREAAPWIEGLARLGYAAKGVVYIVIGGISLKAAVGSGERTAGSEGALESIARQPLGRVMIGLVALGLLGYAVWRIVQAVRDPQGKGGDAKGNAVRAGYAISGMIHAGLALEAARLATGFGQGDRAESGVDSRTAMLMEQPLGRWMVSLVGVGILLFGLYQLYRAAGEDIAKRLRLGSVDADTRRWVIRSGRLGYAARGVVFAIMGYFLVQAAIQYDASEARGLGDALRALQGESYGPWLLGLVALGLMGYGVFALVKARYRRIEPA